MIPQVNWKERYQCEVTRNYYEYSKRNDESPVRTRLLTEREYDLIFKEDYNNIKYIVF